MAAMPTRTTWLWFIAKSSRGSTTVARNAARGPPPRVGTGAEVGRVQVNAPGLVTALRRPPGLPPEVATG